MGVTFKVQSPVSTGLSLCPYGKDCMTFAYINKAAKRNHKF
jgi:hypothetical protein